MAKTFKTIGLIGRHRKEDISDTLLTLKHILQQKGCAVLIEEETAAQLPPQTLPIATRDTFGTQCDLIIVVGGDGSLLSAAHLAVNSKTPVLGINRGRLGFLTDIHPSEIENSIAAILDGSYLEEKRFLLQAQVEFSNKIIADNLALNDVVVMPGDIAQMIEFSIVIDEQFVCTQRADGLIIATPTGSTAYALSGGGPILHPHLDAIALVPMFPHTLTARPIVIAGNSHIKVQITSNNETTPQLSCDGKARIALPPGSNLLIQKHPQQLRLIHPADYSYFTTLRKKLHWNVK